MPPDNDTPHRRSLGDGVHLPEQLLIVSDLWAPVADAERVLDKRTLDPACVTEPNSLASRADKKSIAVTSDEATGTPNALSSLSRARKNVLFVCFCLSIYIDAAGTTGMFVMTEPIAQDLDIARSDEAWIATSYAMVFAAFMLLAGRLADLFPPHIVFTVGYFGLGVLWLVISFMQNQSAFFVLRGICALFAVLTVPSSLNMIVQMYPDKLVQAKKLALFGMAGGLSSTLSPILVGAFLLESWRWFFRFVAFVAIPFSIFAWIFMPKSEAVAQKIPGSDKLKRLDIGGVLILVSALILFMLAFSQASSAGWKAASFIAPLVISIVVLFPAFIFWERMQKVGHSLLPHDMWKYHNIVMILFLAMAAPGWFGTYQLRCAVYFQSALGDSSIVAAAKLVPMGVMSVAAGLLCQPFPQLIINLRVVQPIGCILAFGGTMLLAFSGGGHGVDYWKYIFPGQLFGTFGAMLLFIGMNTAIIQSFPVEFAGVAGSLAQVVFSIGSVVAIAIQSGLVSTGSSEVTEWTGDRNAYIFISAYLLFMGILFPIIYKNPPKEEPKSEDEKVSPGTLA